MLKIYPFSKNKEKLFHFKQIYCEIGYGFGMLSVGLLISFFQKHQIATTIESYAFIMLLAILSNATYILLIYFNLKHVPTYLECTLENEVITENNISEKESNKFGFSKQLILAMLALFFLNILVSSEDSLSSFRMASAFDSGTLVFGLQNVITAIGSLIVLRYMHLLRFRNQLILAVLFSCLGFSLILISTHFFVLLFYGVCTSFITMIHSNNVVIIQKNTDMSEEKIVAVSDISGSLGDILSPYLMFLPLTTFSNTLTIPLLIVSGFLLIQLILKLKD